ncbi:hypothetical protein GCM10009760_17710 [Kitasatospora kazusensis]|uniref:Uncharacterized protein n=1 Tax=Kitasatospora kazusensis TaxID=407974 RepID=A0ABP5KXP1_9ACTN
MLLAVTSPGTVITAAAHTPEATRAPAMPHIGPRRARPGAAGGVGAARRAGGAGGGGGGGPKAEGGPGMDP